MLRRINKKRVFAASAVVLGVTCVASASAIVVTGAGPATFNPFGNSTAPGPSPAQSITALHKLPSVTHVDPSLSFALDRAAQATAGAVAAGQESLRLLREDVGVLHSNIYAFTPSDGVLCVAILNRQGACFQPDTASPAPGVYALLSAGGEGYAGDLAEVPAAVAGVVTDDVASLTLVDGTQELPVAIRNNAFFVEVPEAPRATFTVELRATYTNGTAKVMSLSQDATIPSP